MVQIRKVEMKRSRNVVNQKCRKVEIQKNRKLNA